MSARGRRLLQRWLAALDFARGKVALTHAARAPARAVRTALPVLVLALVAAVLLLPDLAAAQAAAGAGGFGAAPAPAAPLGEGGIAGALEAVTGGLGRNAALLVVAMTALSLAPGIAIAVTCFPFIVTVLSILRQSLGLPQSPPNILIVALSLFLTWFVMDPVLREAWDAGGRPLQQGTIGLDEAFARGMVPLRGFMAARTDPGTLATLAEVAPGRTTAAAGGTSGTGGTAPSAAPGATAGTAAPATGAAGADTLEAVARDTPLSVLIPAFMLSEVSRAFEVGFLIALPFLIIDLVVSAVLMSMGMMMVPPAVVALPFKLAFFVVVNGWGMVAGALVRSYQ